MDTLKDKLSSRKFIVCVLGVLANVYFYHTGGLSADQAMQHIVYIVGIFTVGEAFVDSSREGGILGSIVSGNAVTGDEGSRKPSIVEIASVVGEVVKLVKKDGEKQ